VNNILEEHDGGVSSRKGMLINRVNREQKYFIAYVAYYEVCKWIKEEFFNDIVHTDEEITIKLIRDIESSLLERLNKEDSNPYYGVQIININKI